MSVHFAWLQRVSAGRLASQAFLPLVVVVLVLSMATLEPRFLSRLNLTNVFRNFSFAAIVAIGQMLVMTVGGFDIAVGAVIALASVVSAFVMTSMLASTPEAVSLAVGAGLVAAIGAGMAVGAVSGAVVTQLRVSPFMTTLAIGSVVVGSVFYVTKGSPIYGLPEQFTDFFGREMVLGIPLLTWIALVIGGVAWVVVTRTRTGTHLLATGSNAFSARSSGVHVTRVTIGAYVASGGLAALAGVLLTARVGSGQSALGTTAAIESIAACVIGGVALSGGRASPWRVVVAALFLAIVSNALNLARIDSKWQAAVLGIALLLAALSESLFSKETRNA